MILSIAVLIIGKRGGERVAPAKKSFDDWLGLAPVSSHNKTQIRGKKKTLVYIFSSDAGPSKSGRAAIPHLRVQTLRNTANGEQKRGAIIRPSLVRYASDLETTPLDQ